MWSVITPVLLVGVVASCSHDKVSSSGASYSLDLSRRSSTSMNHEERRSSLESEMASTCIKYGVKLPKINRSKRSSVSSSVNLSALPRDFGYYASISIGTPPKPYMFLMDTGSSDLVVLSAPCSTGCPASTPLYNASNSNTSALVQSSYSIQYGTGSGSGTVYTDAVSFAGMTVPKQRVGAITNAINIAVSPIISGIAGLAWSSLSSNQFVPLLEGLFQTHQLAAPVFGFALSQVGVKSGVDTPGGIMNVGFLDENLYSGSINFIDSPSQIFWDIALQEISIKGVGLGLGYPKVTIDTGSSNLYFPVAVADKIYAAISKNSRTLSNGLYSYPCSAAVNLAFDFGGQRYTINDSSFNLGPSEPLGIYCYGAVNAIPQTNGKDQYIIGDAFLRTVYVAFRFSPSAVGFAQVADPANPRNSSSTTANSTTASGNVVPASSRSASASAIIIQSATTIAASPKLTVYQKIQNALNVAIACSIKTSAQMISTLRSKSEHRKGYL